MNLTETNVEPTLAPQVAASILTLNSGSSSIRFALYRLNEALTPLLNGKLERVALSGTVLTCNDLISDQQSIFHLADHERKSAVIFLIDWLEQQPFFTQIKAVGHLLVHGMEHTLPMAIDHTLLAELHRYSPFDPEHLLRENELIEVLRLRHPHLMQVACFDTVAPDAQLNMIKTLPTSKRFIEQGVPRYGFHGLSYAFLMQELVRLGDAAASKGRVILAHLGNSASMAAVLDGATIDTSMGFTPTGGLPMGSRSGDINPNLIRYFAHSEQRTATQYLHPTHAENSLVDVSKNNPDIHDVLAKEVAEVRAADAVALFCYQAKKLIGAYAAALGGVDVLVFSGGIGENEPSIRARICENLSFLGIALDNAYNNQNAAIISTTSSHTKIRVIHTNEELMIARSIVPFLQ